MLDLFTGRSSDCTGVSRRTFLRVGGLAALGLTLPGFLRLRRAAAEYGAADPKRKAVRCILLAGMVGGANALPIPACAQEMGQAPRKLPAPQLVRPGGEIELQLEPPRFDRITTSSPKPPCDGASSKTRSG